MIEFVTLNGIVTDLLNIIRGSQITQSEPISKRQLEAWVHQYRAKLIKQDLDKGKMPNPDYIQTIQALELTNIDEAQGTTLTTDRFLLRSNLEIPNTLDLNFKSGYMYIGTVEGDEIQFMPEQRARWQTWKKYTKSDKTAFLRDNHLYIYNDHVIKYITVRGVFEVPTEISHLNNPNETITQVTLNSPYPMPISMIPTLKEMILKGELGIEMKAPSDKNNDAASVSIPNYIQTS